MQITWHCLKQVSEALAGGGICMQNHLALSEAGLRNPGRRGDLHANDLALFSAGLRNPDRRQNLHANHLVLFLAGLRSPGRRGDLHAKSPGIV